MNLELVTLAWAIAGYVALQVLLNLLSMAVVARTREADKPLTVVKTAFAATLINAAYFILLAVLTRALGVVESTPPRGNLPLQALLGVPVGCVLWLLTTQARKAGEELFGRGDLVLAEEAVIRMPLSRRLLFWGMLNLSLLQPLARELFLRGLMLPAVARTLGWPWAIGSMLAVEFLLRLNVVWAPQTLAYAGVMLAAFLLTGNALLGLTAAVVSGFIQSLVLLRVAFKKLEEREAREAAQTPAL